MTSPASADERAPAVEATGVWKVFNEGLANEVTALQDVSLDGRGGRVRLAHRAVGLRQEHAAAGHRRPDPRDAR